MSTRVHLGPVWRVGGRGPVLGTVPSSERSRPPFPTPAATRPSTPAPLRGRQFPAHRSSRPRGLPLVPNTFPRRRVPKSVTHGRRDTAKSRSPFETPKRRVHGWGLEGSTWVPTVLRPPDRPSSVCPVVSLDCVTTDAGGGHIDTRPWGLDRLHDQTGRLVGRSSWSISGPARGSVV